MAAVGEGAPSGRLARYESRGPNLGSDTQGFEMKRLAKSTIPIAISGIILFVVLSHFGLEPTIVTIRRSRTGFLLLGFALMVSAYLLRGGRWLIWERSLSYWNSIRLILIGFMGNNILPARLGELLRAHCTSPKTSNDRGRTTALASIAAERILDGSILAVFAFIGIALIPMDRRVQEGLLLVSFAFVALAFGLIFGVSS